jgi:Tol biopolymer transport system component
LVLRRFVQLLFTVLALGLVSSAGATPPGANGRIVYSSSRDGNSELYSMAPDGSSERRLTWTNATEQNPAWSPDGTKIAYERAILGSDFRIWVMNADGSGQTQVSQASAGAGDTDAAWSPDGTQIAFSRGSTLRIMNADGTGAYGLNAVFANSPSWSPDGTQLVYVGLNGLGVMNANGSNAHTITSPGPFPTAPSWSPDGRHIVFARNDSRGYPGELYVTDPDGSNEIQLTTGGFNNANPVWSPDGTKVAFQRAPSGPGAWNVWTIGADGLGAQQLSSGSGYLSPDWGTSLLTPEPSPPDAPSIDIYAPTAEGIYFPGRETPAYYACFSAVTFIVSCQGDVPLFAPIDVSTAGPHTFTVRAVDAEGRTATKTVTYEVLDLTPPIIDLRTPADGATYELDSNVTIDYSCSDPGGSGIGFCQGDLPSGAPLDTSNAGTRRFNVTAADNAGHFTETNVTYTIVDRRPPRIEIQSPIADHEYPQGSYLSANYYCWSPGAVHILSCDGTLPNGATIDTNSIGPHTFTVTARDANGKSTTKSATYKVIYDFRGFDSPVDTGGNLSGVRAGDSISLKFTLHGNQGPDVITGRTWQQASCGDWIPMGASTPTDGRLTYTPSIDRYKDNVPTSSSFRGTCRLLRLDFADGTHPEVRINFR